MSDVVFAPPPARTSHVDEPGGAVPVIVPAALCNVQSTGWPVLLSTRKVRVPAAKSSLDVHSGTSLMLTTGATVVVVVDSGSDDSGAIVSGTVVEAAVVVGNTVVGAAVVVVSTGTVVG